MLLCPMTKEGGNIAEAGQRQSTLSVLMELVGWAHVP